MLMQDEIQKFHADHGSRPTINTLETGQKTGVLFVFEGGNKRCAKHTTDGIRCWSPTQLLAARFMA